MCPDGHGKYHVPDAGHRLTILNEKHRGTTEVMCQVVSGPELFEELNHHLNVNPNDKFKVALGCGLQPEVRIAQILKKNGIGIYYGSRPPLGMTASPSAFLKMYEDEEIGAEFPRIVEMLVDVYQREEDGQIDPACLSADFIRGLTCYLTHTTYTLEQVWASLQLSTLSAEGIAAMGRQQATNGSGRWKAIAEIIGQQVKKNYRKAA